MFDISAVLNVHAEGLLAHTSLLSLLDAKAEAEARGLLIDTVVIADCPDPHTREYLQTARQAGARVIETDVNDLGTARNIAVDACSSRYIAFLDGDDLWTSNWLHEAYDLAERNGKSAIWHPEANFYFGSDIEPYWVMHPDMHEHDETWMRLGLANIWTSLAFASRDTFIDVPYPTTDLRLRFGYEDWHWNCETVARGIVHRVVPKTAHLIRVRSSSLVRRTSEVRSLARPSSLFKRKLTEREHEISRRQQEITRRS